MEPGKIAKHPAPEIGLCLGLMLNVNQDKILLAPQLRLHHQIGLIPLATGDVSEEFFIEKAYRVVHETSTEIGKKQLEKFHEERREQLLEQAIMIDHYSAACRWGPMRECHNILTQIMANLSSRCKLPGVGHGVFYAYLRRSGSDCDMLASY